MPTPHESLTLALFTPLDLILACGVAEGLTDAQIGAQIGMSRDQIKYYYYQLKQRLHLTSRTALALLLYSIA